MMTPVAKERFLAEARAALATSKRGDPLADIRLLRRFAYSNILFSAVGDGALNVSLQQKATDLRSALDAVETSKDGVWCSGSAVILARLYEELGYKTQLISWGSQPVLSHTQVLVEVGGEWYLEDAYFNFDYVDDQDHPLPYFEVLRRFSAGKAPAIRQDLDERIGLFANPKQAIQYVPPTNQNQVDCIPRGPLMACDVTMTVARFLDSWFQRKALDAFLDSVQLPLDRPDFLMLYPAWASETRRGQPFNGPTDQVTAQAVKLTHCWSRSDELACDPQRGRPVLAPVFIATAPDGSRALDVAWKSLVPNHLASGKAPVDIITPALAYDYGAITDPISFKTDEVIELSVQVAKGRIGAVLTTPGGAKLVSKETAVIPADGLVNLEFVTTPSMGPVSILLRNYGDPGVAGAGWVTEVRARPVSN